MIIYKKISDFPDTEFFFAWIHIVFAWIRIRIKVRSGSRSETIFFLSWIRIKMIPTDSPHCILHVVIDRNNYRKKWPTAFLTQRNYYSSPSSEIPHRNIHFTKKFILTNIYLF